MKVKSLLTVACLAASLSASAVYPLEFRDAGLDGADMKFDKDGKPMWNGGGHFDYPVVEGTRVDVAEGGKKISYGTPLFAEDGSITLTRQQYDGGSWFRTKKLTEECDKKYTVFAMDYKCNRDVNDLVLWLQEGFAPAAEPAQMFSGALFTVSDQWQSVYVVIDREKKATAAWGDAENFAKSYFWVNWNTVTPGWELTVKNIRLLTLDEASAECKAATGDVFDSFMLPNNSLSSDVDPDMGCSIYTLNPEGDGNGLLQTGNLVRPLPEGCTTFCYDYKMVGEPFTPNVLMHKVANYTQMIPTGVSDTMVPLSEEEAEDPYSAEWKTAKIDLAEAVKANNFAQTFGSNHFLWIQFKGMNPDNMMWIKNPRWINPNAKEESGVAEIGVAERPADNRVFNLMGVEVKGELTPGLYIRNGKKFIVK